MKGLLFVLFGLMVAVGVARAEGESSPRVVLQTSKGDIVLALDGKQAPQSVANFLAYVEEDFYVGTIFHRVIDGFMIQGGGHTVDLVPKQTRGTLENEADNGLENKRGTVAMARRPDPHSASAQFFINTVDNPGLNHREKTPAGWGYAVFGEVVEGMDVVDAIAKVKTSSRGGMSDVPEEPVVIEKAYIQEQD